MAQYKHDSVLPNKQSTVGKKEQVASMFDDVAKRYDFLNRFLSLGIDITWRKKAIAFLKPIQPKVVLDVATGTADVALMTHKILAPQQIVGIDISDGMLDIGRKKITAKGLDAQIQLYNGDSADISFDNNSFDAATVSFGVRNFEFLEKGLSEILRVVKPNGRLVILEFSKPKNVFVKTFYNFYMKVISPNVAKLFSKNKEAYQYLDESIQKFPEGKDFVAVMEKVGFRNTIYKPLTFGICSIYCGTK
jgi:demethylmenaquinone methyltransferase / 2-methoxy-6-polyprenyl-1,4-benzoquinol methylase